MSFSVLIIEDNPSATASLSSILTEHKNIELLSPVATLAEAEIAIFTERPALLFMDVELPDGDGIEFWESIRENISWNIYIIFYTAFDQYVIKALRAKAHDYLLKPVLKADVDEALQRFYLHCTEQFIGNSQQSTLNAQHQIPEQSPLLVIDNKSNRIAIQPSDVGFFRYIAERKVWEVFCTDGNSYVLRHGVNAARLVQISNSFEQVHKSFIVNLTYMARIEDKRIILSHPFEDIDFIQVSRIYRNAIYEHFNLL